MTHEIRITIRISQQLMRALLILAMLVAAPLELGSESLTLSTTYPSPAGVYNNLIVTGRTGIGATTPTALLHLKYSSTGASAIDAIRFEDTDGTPGPGPNARTWRLGAGTGAVGTFTLRDDTAGANRLIVAANGDVTINGGANQVYRCLTAGTLPIGALTLNTAGNCATSQALPLFVP